jgi:MFS family permease
MFLIYFLASGIAVLAAFGLPLEPPARLFMYFPIGLTVFGVFGAFTYYLPELYPTRLRGTGAGFCYNAGRLIAAAGPFLVGAIASRGVGALGSALQVLFYVGLCCWRDCWSCRVMETKDDRWRTEAVSTTIVPLSRSRRYCRRPTVARQVGGGAPRQLIKEDP